MLELICLRIRRLKLSEVDLIAKLMVDKYPGEDIDAVREHVEWHLKGFPEFCLAAEEKGRLLGFIICHLHENSLEIEELYAVKGKEWIFKSLINEVLSRIPKVDTITIWIDNFRELIERLR